MNAYTLAILGLTLIGAPLYIYYSSPKEHQSTEHQSIEHQPKNELINTESITKEKKILSRKEQTFNSNLTDTTHNTNKDSIHNTNPIFYETFDSTKTVSQLDPQEIDMEIDIIKDSFDKYGVIEGLNKDLYSESERQEIYNAINYLTELRKRQIDIGNEKIQNDINAFKAEIENGVYPEPQLLSEQEIEEIKKHHTLIAENKNSELLKKIRELEKNDINEFKKELGI